MEELAKLMGLLSGENGEGGGFDFNSAFENVDVDRLLKMAELFSKLNQNDANTDLLMALKPHLSPERQNKVDTAVKLSRMMSLMPFLRESGILGDFF